MFLRLGKLVSRHWLLVVLGWVVAVALLRVWAPAWDDVTQDGDFAYLPAEMPSVVGEHLLTKGFSENRPKSQIAFFVLREDGALERDDLHVAYDLARRLKNLHAVAALSRGRSLAEQAERLRQEGQEGLAEQEQLRAQSQFEKALLSLDEAVRLDENMAEYEAERAAAEDGQQSAVTVPRLAEVYYNRHLLHKHLGNTDLAEADLQQALALAPSLADEEGDPLPREAATLPLLDVWTWLDDIFGKKLRTKSARLVVLQLSNEFMATDNIRVLDYLEQVLETVRTSVEDDSVEIGFSGSAAVGGDLLRSAKDSIKNTELFTVVLVVLILGVVYRSPLLIAMPLLTITVSLVAATAIVALLTQLGTVPGFDWWNFQVFTTTRIFIVVILFGAGTDYFLFLVARYKEELQRGLAPAVAVEQALAGVGDASGPAIALCLAVTLLACITLAPALLRAFGPAVFWPFGIRQTPVEQPAS
jgi:putative drug exporter of the RND superfamily